MSSQAYSFHFYLYIFLQQNHSTVQFGAYLGWFLTFPYVVVFEFKHIDSMY